MNIKASPNHFMNTKKNITKSPRGSWYVLLLLVTISSNYCENSDQDAEKALFTLLVRYQEGEEISRAKAVGIDYRPICIRESLIEEGVLTKDEGKKVFNVDGKLDKEFLRAKIYKDPLRGKLTGVLEKIKQKDLTKNSKSVDDFNKMCDKNPEEFTSTDSDVIDIALQAVDDSRLI